MTWINKGKDWFNIDDFCHIWIMTHFDGDPYSNEPPSNKKYYAMGEWRHNGEEVIITCNWDCIDQLKHYLNGKTGIV